MQAAQFADQFVSGAQIQMIGISENDLRAELFQSLIAKALDRRLRPDRHEGRRFDLAMRSNQAAEPRAARIGF